MRIRVVQKIDFGGATIFPGEVLEIDDAVAADLILQDNAVEYPDEEQPKPKRKAVKDGNG